MINDCIEIMDGKMSFLLLSFWVLAVSHATTCGICDPYESTEFS